MSGTSPATRRAGFTRAGFTLVELLVVVLIAGIVMAAVFQVLVSNQRIYTAQGETVRGQQTVRGAIELLSTEVREISPAGGDILSMEEGELGIRAMRATALVCDQDGLSPIRVFVTTLAGSFSEGEEVLVYFQEEDDSPNDNVWVAGELTNIDGTGQPQRCGDEPTSRFTLDNFSPEPLTARVLSGSLIRSWDEVTYSTTELDGETFLSRIEPDGSESLLIGPVHPTRGLEFAYLDGSGSATTDPLQVRSIRITVRTLSTARTSGGRQIADSLSVLVTPRN